MQQRRQTRTHDRVPFRSEVKVWTRRLPASIRTRNISTGGIFVEATEGLALNGSYVTVTLELDGAEPIHTICRVVRRESGIGAGLEFLDLPATARAVIRDYVAEHFRPSVLA